jgi:steroid delta-isomerase-like uncharacterized protein
MQQDLASIPRILVDSFNNRNTEQALLLFSDDAQWMDMCTQKVFRGKEGYRQFDQAWLTAFPDGKVEIKDIMVSDDRIVVEYIGRGTQTGPLTGPEGVLQPTGKHVELPMCDIMQIKSGLIVSGRTYYDSATLMRQLRGTRRVAA